MTHLLEAEYISVAGGDRPVRLLADAGDWIFVNGTPSRCQRHFEILSGLRKPDTGKVKLAETDLYALPSSERAAFRRDTIGAVPAGGGLIPELRLIDQIALPMALAGYKNDEIQQRIHSLTSELLPLYSLYNTPKRCTVRKGLHAAILRAVIMEPKLLILDRLPDDLSEPDADVLWQALKTLCPKDCAVLCLSGGPAPAGIFWTREILI